jgi:trehalose 6-phosphate synthase/phosphatase
LFLLPGLIREKRPDVTIGFFLHIPFPSYQIFRLLHRPWKEKIIRGLLGADLIGFHTYEYVHHFLKTVSMVAGLDHQYRSIILKDRIIKADIFPIGIDYRKFQEAGNDPLIQEQKSSVLSSFVNRKIIFSVDRLDYTKGVTHRLAGFERFLELFPQWIEQVVFILVVVPSRQIISKYNERRKLIEEQVGRINGKYSTLGWQPIIYQYKNLSFPELSSLYQTAHVALITPLRDGMNLVAKEYVASRADQDGVLILSELAGAASEMGEAVLVNPMDKEEVAKAIDSALTMPLTEQEQSMTLMQKRLIDYDVVHWVSDFFRQLLDVKDIQQSQRNRYLTSNVMAKIIDDFKAASNRLLFLDYDGTLVPFARHPKQALPGKELLDLLDALSNDEQTQLVIVSGRNYRDLDAWFSSLPVHLIAEHGAATKYKGDLWHHEFENGQDWKELIRPSLQLFKQRSPGSFIEEKNYSLAWHYRAVDPELGFIRSRELLDNLYNLVRNTNLNIIEGNKVIEVRVGGVDKGTAAKKIFDLFPSDFAIAVGDDKTDEDMFKALADKAVTMKVGSDLTAAQYNLTSHYEVIKLLQQLK